MIAQCVSATQPLPLNISRPLAKHPSLVAAGADLGFTNSQAAMIVCTYPNVLSLAPDTIRRKRAEQQADLGLTFQQVLQLSVRVPGLVLADIRSPTYQAKLRWWRKHDGRPYTELRTAYTILRCGTATCRAQL